MIFPFSLFYILYVYLFITIPLIDVFIMVLITQYYYVKHYHTS